MLLCSPGFSNGGRRLNAPDDTANLRCRTRTSSALSLSPMALYLITGVGGFIGSSLAHELLRRGQQVRGVDNFSTGKRENLAPILDQIDFRETDILDLEAMQGACAGVEYVLHQAAIPS